jgi:aspartate/methionine/tyrosine aminotransferase
VIQVADRLQDVQEYYFSKKLREIDELNRSGEKVINLGIGSPDLPPHPDVVDVLHVESAKPHTHAYQSYKGAPA